MAATVVNVASRFEQVSEYWHPRIAAELNGQHVKLAKLKGEFVWHSHAAEDELFFVARGTLTIRLRDRDLAIGPGEFVVIPRGVEHLPVAEEEVWVLLLEPASTRNTGDVENDRTVDAEWFEDLREQ